MDETALLDELRRQVEELRASRARIAAIANSQRRDIERGLHDGVQQDLVVLAVKLQLAEDMAASDPVALRRLLVEMRQDVHDALEGVRELARGVYPTSLIDLGLAEALRGAVRSLGIPIEIEASNDRYPADIEATVYFCCLESLEPMSGVGAARGASLRVWAETGSVLFEVIVEAGSTARDVRVPDSVRIGLSDRMGAVDGTLTIIGEPGDLRIRGTIPLGPDRSATLG